MTFTPDHVDIAPEIEAAFEEMGRSLVHAAILMAAPELHKQSGKHADGTTIEVTVAMPLSVQMNESQPGMQLRGTLCCACVKYSDGEIRCTGSCCAPPKLPARALRLPWEIEAEVEDGYAAIGRSAIRSGIQQHSSTSRSAGEANSTAETLDAGVVLSLTIQAGGVAERMPVLCCVCHRVDSGKVECAGACCPK